MSCLMDTNNSSFKYRKQLKKQVQVNLYLWMCKKNLL